MHLHELLTPEHIRTGFDPGDKWNAIRLLVGVLVESGALSADQELSVLEGVEAREHSMSTGMEDGLAIPHTTLEGIDHAMAAMGVVPEGVGLDFDAIDGLPTRVVVLLVIPAAQKMGHIRTLAEVARVLGTGEAQARVFRASSPAEAHAALASAAEAAG